MFPLGDFVATYRFATNGTVASSKPCFDSCKPRCHWQRHHIQPDERFDGSKDFGFREGVFDTGEIQEIASPRQETDPEAQGNVRKEILIDPVAIQNLQPENYCQLNVCFLLGKSTRRSDGYL